MSRLRPWELLYDAVALGMAAYAWSAFRPRLLAPPGWRLRPGRILVATHRAETDVPILCPLFFLSGHVWRKTSPRLSFAAREDMFERGFFAGFPEGLSPRARRLLYPIRAGTYLPRVRVCPIPYPAAGTIRLGRALEQAGGDLPLAELLPAARLAPFETRAAELGLPRPVHARDVLRGEYADLLWVFVPRDELDAPALDEVWRRRGETATAHLREVVELVRSGEPVLFFPEGRPSPDGAIGPLRRGLAMLVRRGRPAGIEPVSVAYDPLTAGRPRVLAAVGEELLPPADDVDAAVVSALRRTMPLTCGQVVAVHAVEAARAGAGGVGTAALRAAIEEAVAAARSERRPVDPVLVDVGTRSARLEDCLRAAARRPGLGAARGGEVGVDAEAVLADPVLRRLETEYASARGPAAAR